jgi:LysM repeat protein
VRQGDNLFSIAKYFGVSLNAVERRNPWTKTTALAAGQKLQLPAPTR